MEIGLKYIRQICTYISTAELLEDGVKATVKDSRVANCDCCHAPDELNRVGQSGDVQLLPVNCSHDHIHVKKKEM